MNDALDRREESGPGGRLDQVVFRWNGNQGRSSTGMAAVAHSCSAERAESLRRELGPLLWVPGPGPAPRQSSVRVSSRSGGTVLLQRWPTLDRGGRPSTACHAVFGDADTLTPLRCLALGGTAWSDRAVAETAAGGLPTLDAARLRATADERLREMSDELPTVKKPLMVVTAEWLRDPSRRLSLLAEEHELPGWPRRNRTPLLYLGLLSVFGDWFGTEWSYATYDTVDTHALRLTCVPEWSSQAAGARSLARVRLRLPAEGDVEMAAAKELVEYVLDRPGAAPGVPLLTGELLSGARLTRQERREALRRMLNARHAPSPAPAREEDRYVRQEDRYASEPRQEDRYAAEDRERDRYARRDRQEDGYAGEERQEDRYTNDPRQEDRYAGEERQERQDGQYPHRDRQENRYTTEPRQQDRHTTEPRRQDRYGTGPRQEDRYARQDREARHEQERRRLHEELLVHQRVDAAQSARLAARLRDLRDAPLLTLLSADGLPWASRDLVLDELARTERLRSRDEATEQALCTEVLRHNLYFRPGRPEADSPSAPEMRERAAELFSWAVAPLVRDPHRAPDLRPLFNIVLKDGRDTGMEWLRRILVAPPGGRAPDLPPQLWQQVVTDLLAHPASVPVPAPAPARAPAPPATVPAPAPSSAPAPVTPPVPLPSSYTAASSTAPPPPRPAPMPTAHPTAPRQKPARPAPTRQGGDSPQQGFLYQNWFVGTVAGIVGAAVIGLLLLILLN
ncbi:hypothetical protein [Streptomyces sp. NPDC058542]|uniref:hypothetical protein n=1 Tax=Streptomyces sp. NPDC058542 TaxID=3346543 RepID=UPI0036628521